MFTRGYPISPHVFLRCSNDDLARSWVGTGPASSCELHAAAVGGTDHGVILVEVQDVALDEVRQIAILTPGIKWMKYDGYSGFPIKNGDFP